MKYKIHYKSLDSITNKEVIINKIKEFYKNKYLIVEQREYSDLTVFNLKEYLPSFLGFETEVKLIVLIIDWYNIDVSLSQGAIYKPFTKEELKFFDSLDFDLSKRFADDVEQQITDWVVMKDEI
jgi:hypothetical protein